MICSFGDSATEELYHGRKTSRVRKFPTQIISPALRKLDMIEAANDLKDLRVPPGNHLEELKGKLAGFHSIRINDQWRIIFKWDVHSAEKVSIIDYH